MNRIFFLAILVLVSGQGFSQQVHLSSPNGKLKVALQTGKNTGSIITYDLFNQGQAVLREATIGFEIAGDSTTLFKLSKVDRKKVANSWKPVYGERNSIPENYNQLTFHFRSATNPSQALLITCRAYNEGFAFQYAIAHKNKAIELTKEVSEFPLNASAVAWISTTAQGILHEKKVGEIKGVVERPLTVKLGEKLMIALGEASLVDFARMKFARTGSSSMMIQLDGNVKGRDSLISPWRYLLIGKDPADLLQKNYMVLNLNQPNQIEDTKWIKPGKVIREATLTTVGSFATIDFAARHNIQYICFDAGWYGKEDSDTSDATRVSIDPARYKGPLDLQKVIRYANQKNVGVILYINRRAVERQLDTLLPLYQSWGVKGLKYGFVNVGSQQWTSWLHEAVRKAARYQMVVDVHDEYRPTGYSRTYPNLLTQEGIRGDEESPYTEHTITTLFTRMIAGAGDNTICYFTNRVNTMSSHAAQMAKAVCIYSPMQFLYWYDRPVADTVKTYKEGEIQQVPELAWFDALPTVWDETCVLEGDMTQYATIARKKGKEWFVGSLNGTSERKVNLPFTFLDRNKNYIATIYTDDVTVNTATQVKVTRMKVSRSTVLPLTIAARKGVAIHIKPE